MEHNEGEHKFLDNTNSDEPKSKFYARMIQETKALIDGESDLIANTANISSLIYFGLNTRSNALVNWAGFYFMRNGELVLGPFQGKTACIRIKVGRGVCGTAVQKQQTQLVYDVHKFPVVPIIKENKVLGVLDLDSPRIGGFDEEDQKYLEEIVSLLISGCDFSSLKE